MENKFGTKLKELREEHFKGQSLRRVGEMIAVIGNFGDHFFTQLSKMEAGTLMPSPNQLLKLMDAYSATEAERKEIFTAYSTCLVWEKMAQVDKITKNKTRDEAVHQLYRRVKKNK